MTPSSPDNTVSSYCRLFLATPFCFDLQDLQPVLAAAIAAGDIACLLLRHDDREKLREAAMSVTKMAQDADIAVLINEEIEIALACGADGVQVSGAGVPYDEARERLGDDKIVGVYCGTDRHRAMSSGEAGADYVAFADEAVEGENEPIGHWWARVFEVPCVVMGSFDLSGAEKSIAAKVDFLCPDGVWSNETVAHETVTGLNRLIKETKIEAV